MDPEPRELIVSELTTDVSLLTIGEWGVGEDWLFQFGSFNQAPAVRPFVVLKFQFTSENEAARGVGRTKPFQLWVHDTPGDFLRIDRIIDRAQVLLLTVPNQGDFIEFSSLGASDEFQDEEMGTILRYATFGMVAS